MLDALAALAGLEQQGFRPAGKQQSPHFGNSEVTNGHTCPTHGKQIKESKHRPGEFFGPVKIAEDNGTGSGKAVYCRYKLKS